VRHRHGDGGAQDGDEIVIEHGEYDLTEPIVNDMNRALDIHGEAGYPPPVIFGVGTIMTIEDPGTTLRDVMLTPGAGHGQALEFHGKLVDEVVAQGIDETACFIGASSIVRNTVCGTTSADYAAMTVATGLEPTVLRNVTAVGPGDGIRFYYEGDSSTAPDEASLVNVIARGGPGAHALVALHSGDDNAPQGLRVSIAHSNYATEVAYDDSTGQTGGPFSIIDGGGNQTAAPQFEDAPRFDFREAPGSPTIGAGAVDVFNGNYDALLTPRITAGRTDIGAFQAPAPTLPPASSPPVGAPRILDTKPPVFGSASIARTFSLAGSHGGTVAPLTLSLSEPAQVRATVTERVGGRLLDGRCKAASKANRGNDACTRSVRIGTSRASSDAARRRCRCRASSTTTAR
jgi:hypothetical protein